MSQKERKRECQGERARERERAPRRERWGGRETRRAGRKSNPQKRRHCHPKDKGKALKEFNCAEYTSTCKLFGNDEGLCVMSQYLSNVSVIYQYFIDIASVLNRYLSLSYRYWVYRNSWQGRQTMNLQFKGGAWQNLDLIYRVCVCVCVCV